MSRVLEPKLDDKKIQARIEEARANLPVPVFWLFGKAQSGKTSIIRALTGSSEAEIGNGFQPCTSSARVYRFPGDDDPLLEFLDTRGLGEVRYDPTEDIEAFAAQAHVLIVVVKALDHAQAAVLEPLEVIMRRRRDWPVIVAQTCLHEAYPGKDHPQPYPYRTRPWPSSVPADLARSLEHQRKWFSGRHVQFVPIDFTLPEDGFHEAFYGLDALWDAIETALPWGLRAMLGGTPDVRSSLRAAHRRLATAHVVSYSVAAGAAAALPVPMIDVPLILAVQGKLFHSVSSIYGQELTRQRIAEIGSTIGAGYLARLGGRELLKFVPGWGSAVAATYAAATTFALGQLYVQYFESIERGYLPQPEQLKSIYAQEFQRGRRMLRQYLEKTLAERDQKP